MRTSLGIIALSMISITCLCACSTASSPEPEPSEDDASAVGWAQPVFIDGQYDEVLSHDNVRHVRVIMLEAKERQGEMKRWSGDNLGNVVYEPESEVRITLSELTDEKVALAPGFYQFNHNSVYGNPPAGMYGKSMVFEVKAGETIEVRVPLNAAI